MIDPSRVQVGRSRIDEITDEAFATTERAEVERYRDRLYSSLNEAEKLTWAKIVVFLSSLSVFYLMASNRAAEIKMFGADVKDVFFLRKVYPFYIFYVFYQFFYAYAWTGIVVAQLEALNRKLMRAAAEAKLHYFTYPTNPHLLRNFAARHLGLGVVTKDLLVSAAASFARLLILAAAAVYVYYTNIRDLGFLNIATIGSLLFGLAVVLRFLGILFIHNRLTFRPLKYDGVSITAEDVSAGAHPETD